MKKISQLVANVANHALEALALAQFNAGRHKEAAELYKKLLQGSDNPDWRQKLASCYLQRALALGAKGSFKEALVLWENYSQHALPPHESFDHYLLWLIQAKNPGKTQAALAQLSAEDIDQHYPALAALLGLLAITSQPELAQQLPQDSVFITHLKIVQTALQAFQENNWVAVDEALKSLPYRSAFRDFRSLLKATMAIPSAMAEAQTLLAKIPADSPYAQAAALLSACTQQGAALAKALQNHNHQQCLWAGDVLGLNKSQVDLLSQINKHGERLSDKQKFNLVCQYQSLFGPALAQQFCFSLLTAYPAGQQDYKKHFGGLSDFEAMRLQALVCEQSDRDFDAIYYWRQGIRLLAAEESDNAMKIALILRHLASKEQGQDKIDLLAESMDYDAEDRDCYQAILKHYAQYPESAALYQQWLDKTLAKFPDDLDVLVLALKSATSGKHYEKASQYALSLLKVDPINTYAKNTLFKLYLAQARLQLQSKHYAQIEGLLEQAEALKIGKSSAQETQLLRGLLCFATKDKTEGLQQINDALNPPDANPLNSHFQAAMAALLTGLPVATLLKGLPAVDGLLSAQALSQLIQLISEYGQEPSHHPLIHKALDKVKADLKKSVSEQRYDGDLLLKLCQSLDAIQHFELLRHCAKQGHSQWQIPIWIFYKIYAETNNNPETLIYTQVMTLRYNLERAKQEKDHRTAVLLGDYIDRYYQSHPEQGMEELENLIGAGQQDEADEPFDQLFGHLPDEIFYKLDKQVAALAKKTSPERLVKEVNKTMGFDQNLLQAIAQNPDIFSALLMVKAAENLGINTDVCVADVLAAFAVGQKPGNFPF